MAIDYDLVLLGSNLASMDLALAGVAIGARVAWVTMPDVISPFYLHLYLKPNLKPNYWQNWQEYLEMRGIDIIPDTGEFINKFTLRVKHRQITARHFVICDPPHPYLNPNDRLDRFYHANNEFPSAVPVAGGNRFSCAISQFLNSRGTAVTLLVPRSGLLSEYDREVVHLYQATLEASGISIYTDQTLTGQEPAIFPIFSTITSQINLELAQPKRIHYLTASAQVPSLLNKTLFGGFPIYQNHQQKGLSAEIIPTDPPIIQVGKPALAPNLINLRSWRTDYFLKVTCTRSGRIVAIAGIGQRAIDICSAGNWQNIRDFFRQGSTHNEIIEELLSQFYPPTRPNLWLNICRDFDL